MTTRRNLILGLGASLVAAPALVRADSLMQIRGVLMIVSLRNLT